MAMASILSISRQILCLKILILFPALSYSEEVLKKKEPVIYGPTDKSSLFRDATKEYGLENVQGERFFVVDFNNDTYADLVVLPENYTTPVFYQFNKKKKKFIALEKFPFPQIIKASFLLFHDFDKDGIDDVIVGLINSKTELRTKPLRLYQGKIVDGHLTYIPVPFKNDPMSTTSVVLIDYNLDGHIDLFQGNFFQKGDKKNRPAPDLLWRGEGIVFKNQSILLEKEHDYNKSLDLYKNARPTTGVSICDVDLNGYPDILTASGAGNENKMWLNLYDKKHESRIFKDYGTISGMAQDEKGKFLRRSGGNTFFTICTDYNNDSIIDIAVGELKYAHDPPTRDLSSILSGKEKTFPPKFIRTPYSHDNGVKNWSQADRRGLFADINFDGLLDLVIDHSGLPPTSRLVFFQQEADHSFTDRAKEHGINVLNPSGTVVLDVNRDGRLDLLIGQTSLRDGNIPKRIFLMVNKIPRKKKRSIRFYLDGRKSNAQGLNARLVLKTNQRKMQQFVQYSFGEAPSQMEEGLYFGIGHDKLESLEVHWPLIHEKKKNLFVETYNLAKLRFVRHLNITLCENGRFFRGIKKC